MKITDPETFGAAVRSRRKALGLTQADVAAFTGLSVSFLSDLENGKPTAELGKSISTAMILGLDISITARGTDDGK